MTAITCSKAIRLAQEMVYQAREGQENLVKILDRSFGHAAAGLGKVIADCLVGRDHRKAVIAMAIQKLGPLH